MGRKPAAWTAVDRRYENLRISMLDIPTELGISCAAARQQSADHEHKRARCRPMAWPIQYVRSIQYVRMVNMRLNQSR